MEATTVMNGVAYEAACWPVERTVVLVPASARENEKSVRLDYFTEILEAIAKQVAEVKEYEPLKGVKWKEVYVCHLGGRLSEAAPIRRT